jgi:PAS domain-containing protein
MIEGLPVPVFLTDGELRVIHTSDAALQWLNTPREALLGRPIGEILPDRALVDALLAACGRVTRKEANIVADTSRLGGNRVRLVVTDAETEGVLTLVSVG